MATTEQRACSRLAIEVSEDRTQAWICVKQEHSTQPIAKADVIQALEAHDIPITDDVRARVNRFILTFGQAKEPIQRSLVALGRLPAEGANAEFVWDQRFERAVLDLQDDTPADHYTRNSIVTVEAGEVVGRVVPPVPGTDGIDVYGRPIPPTHNAQDIQLDSTVQRAEGSTAIVANVAGKVRLDGARLSIDELLTIRGDLDFESGNVRSTVDVHVAGTVRDLFEVISSKSVYVGQSVEAATVQVEGDLQVRVGILGRGKGKIVAGGTVSARYCADAQIRAEGDVIVAKEVMNSQVWCGNMLLATSAALIGGDIFANAGIEAGSLGSKGCIATHVAVGIDPEVIREVATLMAAATEKRKVADKLQNGAMQVLDNAGPRDKRVVERATHLRSKADKLAATADAEEENVRQMLAAARPDREPYVLVSRTIHPGVTIQFGLCRVVCEDRVEGPVRIEQRALGGSTQIVAVYQESGSVVVLPHDEILAGFACDEAYAQSTGATPEP